jgi:hypothetical protein
MDGSNQLTVVGGGLTPHSARPKTALESLKDWALTFTGESERVPARIANLVPSALMEARGRLAPADDKTLAVEIAALLSWARTFGVPVDDAARVTAFYREGLERVPGDLLPVAMKRARAAHKYGMRLPLPAEIVATIEPEMVERRALVSKLFRAKLAPVEYECGKVDSRVVEINSGVKAHLTREKGEAS